jgi:hypothetical protein
MTHTAPSFENNNRSTSVTQAKSNAVSLTDNRASSILQLKSKELTNKSNPDSPIQKKSSGDVIQRLIVIPKTELDPGMIINVWQMLRNGIDKRVTLLDLLNLEHHPQGEPLHMVGHGYGASGAYGGLSAGNLAGQLMAAGLKPNMGMIKLLSCNSGVGGGASYAAQLSQQLHGIVTITAHSGYGVIMNTGISHGVDLPAPVMAQYQKILSAGAASYSKAEAHAVTVKALLAAAKNEAEVLAIFLKEGAVIYGIVQVLFDQLYAFQASIKPHGQQPDLLVASAYDKRMAADSYKAKMTDFYGDLNKRKGY